MPTARQDTEITLGTGRMLAIFFALVLLCAFFFGAGFSLGRRTTMAGTGTASAPSVIVRPSAAKNEAAPQSNSDSTLAASAQAPSSAAGHNAAHASQSKEINIGIGATAPVGSGYLVQVAAVTRQEDADALVEALKKKEYPAFASNPASDKYYRVQVGPYTDLKDAEAMRARLIGDGYNPIVKK